MFTLYLSHHGKHHALKRVCIHLKKYKKTGIKIKLFKKELAHLVGRKPINGVDFRVREIWFKTCLYHLLTV